MEPPLMGRVPAVRSRSEFIGMDLGVRAAKASATGRRAGHRVFGRRHQGLHHSTYPLSAGAVRRIRGEHQAARAGAGAVRQRTADLLERSEENGRRNRALRKSMAERREALRAARMESRRIVSGSAVEAERRKVFDRTPLKFVWWKPRDFRPTSNP